MLRYFLLLFSVSFFHIGCSSETENLLLGEWKAIELLEQDSSLQVNLDEIRFTFDEKERYTFLSTLNYKEAGTYEFLGNLLYTTDTIQNTSKRKVVKVLELNETSLKIEMKDQKMVRILTLSK